MEEIDRNSIKSKLKKDELAEVDEYIDKINNDLAPIFSFLNKLSKDDNMLIELKKALDTHMRDKKWLEKH